MSKQKSKKASPQMLKQQEAESRKQFYKKVKELFEQINQPELFIRLSKTTLDKMFLLRLMPPVIKHDPDVCVSPDEGKKIKEFVYEYLRRNTIESKSKRISMNGYDFLTIGLTIYLELLNSDQKFPECQYIKEHINPHFFELFDDKKIHNLISVLDICLSAGLSHYDQCLFSITYSWLQYSKHLAMCFQMHTLQVPKKDIIIDGNHRTVFQVGWNSLNRYYGSWIPRYKLDLPDDQYPEQIEVYAQNHVLLRLTERIDNLFPNELHFSLYTSVLDGIILHTYGKHYLIEYKCIGGFKLGYLVALMVEDKLIIKTFLLLSNEGTPEKMKLEKLTGLERCDIEFLKLDKISSFFDKGLLEDQQLIALFEKAGFKPIFDYIRQDDCLLPDKKMDLSERLRKYLYYLMPSPPTWHEVNKADSPMPSPSMNSLQVPEKRAFTPKASTIKQISS